MGLRIYRRYNPFKKDGIIVEKDKRLELIIGVSDQPDWQLINYAYI